MAALLPETLAEVLGQATEVTLVHLGGQMLPRTWSQVTTTWSQVTTTWPLVTTTWPQVTTTWPQVTIPWKKANIDQQSTAC